MNPVVLQFANGNIFFIGMGLVVGASAFKFFHQRRFGRSFLSIASFVGIIFVILSATPLPAWLYAAWFVSYLADLIFIKVGISSGSLSRWRMFTFGAILFASLVLTFIELPFHLIRHIPISTKRHIYVVGDSISAGINANERAWPAVLGDIAGVSVINLARPGATAETALKQASLITDHECLIIVEIGGNDLIGGTDSRVFYDCLNRLLGELCSAGNQVIMLEIPLFPFKNSIGRAQRTLAKKHGVTLLPKTILTKVLGLEGATSDGLHFSQIGHDTMAKEIYSALSFK